MTRNMSFNLPRNVPQFDDQQRNLEDVYYSHTKRGGRELPMYKDKPFNWAGPSQSGPIWRKKRVFAGLILLVLGFLFWRNTERHKRPGRSKWAWKSKSGMNWESRAEEVKDAFDMSWNRYVKCAWGKDRFAPVSKKSERIGDAGMGLFTVGALDTLILMNKTAELSKARDWVATFLTGDQNVEVDIFEIGTKVLGGLLAANYLTTNSPAHGSDENDEHSGLGEDLYIEKATDLADRLLGGFDSPTKVPYPSVNLETRKGSGKIVSTGFAGNMQLELRDLTKNAGEIFFWNSAETVAEALASLSRSGLVISTLAPASRRLELSEPTIDGSTIGYYEAVLKQYLQTSKQESIYFDLWNEAMKTIKQKYIAYTRYTNLPVLATSPVKSDSDSVRMSEASCSLPGLIGLSLTSGRSILSARQAKSWSKEKEAELDFAKKLLKTCWAIHTSQPTGLSPIEVSILVRERATAEAEKEIPLATNREISAVVGAKAHHQAPATLESLYYLFTITGDETYRKWGWDLFTAYRNHTLGPSGEGFYGLDDVTMVPPKTADRLNDLWFSKTLKFFYLLFSDQHAVELDKVVFNSAGHILPRFKLQRNLKTGWRRKGTPVKEPGTGGDVDGQHSVQH